MVRASSSQPPHRISPTCPDAAKLNQRVSVAQDSCRPPECEPTAKGIDPADSNEMRLTHAVRNWQGQSCAQRRPTTNFTCDGSHRFVPLSTFTGFGRLPRPPPPSDRAFPNFQQAGHTRPRQQRVVPLVPPCRQRPRPALLVMRRNAQPPVPFSTRISESRNVSFPRPLGRWAGEVLISASWPTPLTHARDGRDWHHRRRV